MGSLPYFFGQFCLHDGVSYYTLSKQLDPPALQYTTENVARVPGVKTSGSRINERPITVVVRVVGTSRSDLESKLDALFAALQYRQQRLLLHTLDARYFIADCTNAPVSLVAGKPLWADVTCTFTCYQPYAYAPTLSTYTMSAIAFTSQGGGVYASPQQAITGGGNVFSYPTVVITNTGTVAVTSTTLTQQTDGMSITIVSTLNQNDTLTITSDPLQASGLTAVKNTGNPLSFSGAFPIQEPTITNWQISAAAASQPTLQAVWSWQARWAA